MICKIKRRKKMNRQRKLRRQMRKKMRMNIKEETEVPDNTELLKIREEAEKGQTGCRSFHPLISAW